MRATACHTLRLTFVLSFVVRGFYSFSPLRIQCGEDSTNTCGANWRKTERLVKVYRTVALLEMRNATLCVTFFISLSATVISSFLRKRTMVLPFSRYDKSDNNCVMLSVSDVVHGLTRGQFGALDA